MKVLTLCLLTFTIVPWAESLLIKAGLSSDVQELIVGDILQILHEFNGSWVAYGCHVKKDDLGALSFPPPPSESLDRPEGWTYKRLGDPEKECGIEVPVTDKKDNGLWTVQSWTLNLTVLVPPSIVEGNTSSPVLEVDQVATFICSARGSRPAATVVWTIGGEESADFNDTSSRIVQTPDGLFDVHDMLTIYPKARYDDKVLQCTYFIDANNRTTPESFEFNLTVYGPPDPDEFVFNYPEGLIMGSKVRFEFQVHSNPPASNFTYIMHDLDNPIVINITPAPVRQETTQEGRYSFEPITESNKLYTSVMIIDELLSSDVDQEFIVIVANERGSTSYPIKFENPETVGLSSGAIAGIVVGALLGVALVGFLAYYLIKVKKVGKKKKGKSKNGQTSNPGNTHQGETPN